MQEERTRQMVEKLRGYMATNELDAGGLLQKMSGGGDCTEENFAKFLETEMKDLEFSANQAAATFKDMDDQGHG